MPDSTSIHSYKDCEKVLEQALESERGVKVEFPTTHEANAFARRCHSFKKLMRAKNKNFYPDPGHQYHDASIYDEIAVRRKGLTIEFVKASGIPINVVPIEA